MTPVGTTVAAFRPTVMAGLVLVGLMIGFAPATGQGRAGTELRGELVEITDSELVVRGPDGRLEFVNTAAIPSDELAVLEPGDQLVIAIKDETTRGPIGRSARRAAPRPP